MGLIVNFGVLLFLCRYCMVCDTTGLRPNKDDDRVHVAEILGAGVPDFATSGREDIESETEMMAECDVTVGSV